MATPARSYQYHPFGAFRLLLAMLVLVKHYLANLTPSAVAAATNPYQIGIIAVFIFFALSGYVIAEAADCVYQRRPGAFLTNRLLRIVPHYVLAVLLSASAIAWFTHAGTLRLAHDYAVSADAFGARNLVANLLGFLPLSDRVTGTNFVEIGWAVRVEVAFYLVVFAWLWLQSHAVARPERAWTCRAIALALGAGILVLFPLAVAGRAPVMFLFVPYFIYGYALYAVVKTRSTSSVLIAAAALCGIALQFWAQPAHQAGGFEHAKGAETALLVVLLVAMTALAFRTVDRLKRLDRRLGDQTYPVYLYHEAGMVIVLSLTAGYSWAIFATAIVVSFAIAYVLERLVAAATDRLRDRVRGRRIVGSDQSPATDKAYGLSTAVARHT